MGVRSLHSFMCTRVRNGYFLVDIKQTINEAKQQMKEKPLILIEVSALAKVLCSNNKDMLFGGRNAFNAKQIHFFLSELRSLDVNLEFFSKGLTDKPIRNFKALDKTGYVKRSNVFDRIFNNDANFDELITNKTFNYANKELSLINSFEYAAVSICSEYGKINFSFTYSKEKLVAAYATKCNAFAIIGDTTNFLIFCGNWHYWCSKDLNIESMQIMEFNRKALRNEISLRNDQLPLFATCCGNDYVDYDDIKEFQKSLGSFKWKFYNIAKYVNKYKYSNYLTYDELKRLTHDLYGQYTEENVNSIKQSIAMYNEMYVEENSKQYNKHIERWSYDVKIIWIAFGDVFKMRNDCFDDRQTECSNSYPDIMLPIVRRQMGVMLKYKGNLELTKSVLIKATHESDYEELEIHPIYPQIKDLSNDELYRLVYETYSDKEDTRWEILCWMISDSLYQHVMKLKTLPKNYVCSCLALYYLVELNVITVWEADIILLTIDEHYTNGIPDEIKYPEKLKKRSFFLSFLFTKIYLVILTCINIVGLKDYRELPIFDGVYYHNLMQELSEISDELQIPIIQEIQKYRIYSV